MRNVTQNEFAAKLATCMIEPLATRLVLELKQYQGRLVHNIRTTGMTLDFLLRRVAEGQLKAKTFGEFKEEDPKQFRRYAKDLYTAFVHGAYEL